MSSNMEELASRNDLIDLSSYDFKAPKNNDIERIKENFELESQAESLYTRIGNQNSVDRLSTHMTSFTLQRNSNQIPYQTGSSLSSMGKAEYAMNAYINNN